MALKAQKKTKCLCDIKERICHTVITYGSGTAKDFVVSLDIDINNKVIKSSAYLRV